MNGGHPTTVKTQHDFLLLTFNGDYVLSDLVLQSQVIDALDQVVDGVNIRVDRLEPMNLCPDGCWVGQNKLRARLAGLGSLSRNSPRTELTGPRACRRSGSELGRDGLGHWDRNGGRDRAWSGHGWLRLLGDTGHWDARLEIHLVVLSERLTLFTAATQICRLQFGIRATRTKEVRANWWSGKRSAQKHQ